MNTRIDTAMVLAAGLGTRMRPLTDRLPKPLVDVGGRALIDHVLHRLAAAGISQAVVNVHYLADRIEAHLKNREQPKIVISDERDALLDTGGGVARALPLFGTGPFIVHNSDSIWVEGPGSNLQRLLDGWRDEGMDSLLLLAPAATSLGYDGPGDFAMTADGRLRRRNAREIVPFAFTGVSIAHPRMFAGCSPGAFSLNRLWDRAIESGRLFGVRLEGIWMHVGTPESVMTAEDCLRERDRP